MNEDYRPKLSILLTEEQRAKLNKLLPWGTGTLLFSAIIDELIIVLEEYGPAVIGLIVGKRVLMLDLMKLNEQKRGEQSGPVQPKARKSRRSIHQRPNQEDRSDEE